MDIETSRSTIYARIEELKTLFTDFPVEVEYENRKSLDYSALPNPALKVIMEFPAASQRDLSNTPYQRVLGSLFLIVVCKEGEGTAKSLKLGQYYMKGLQRCNLSGLHMLTGAMKSVNLSKFNLPPNVWHMAIYIPFWFDTPY